MGMTNSVRKRYSIDQILGVVENKGLYGALSELEWQGIEDADLMALWKDIKVAALKIKGLLADEDRRLSV